MNILTQFFQTILFQPFLNVLVLLYVFLPGRDFGVAVIVLTLIIKLFLHPLSQKGLKQQKAISQLQPKLEEIKNKFKDDRAQQSKALMELYQKEKVTPVSGCLPLLIQLPIIIALYKVFLDGFKPEVLKANLYSFVPNPGVISPNFLGVLNLESKVFVMVLAILSGIAQFFQMKITTVAAKNVSGAKKKDFASSLQNQMLYIFPVVSVLLVYKLGAVIGLYWLVTTLFSIGEQYIINQKSKSKNQTDRAKCKNSKF